MLESLDALTTPDHLRQCQQQVLQVHASAALLDYLQDLTQTTRNGQWFNQGLSPRAGLAWLKAAKAVAWLDGRDHAIPDDLRCIAPQTLAHRLVPLSGAGRNSVDQVRAMLDAVALP
jgi:MoxR-like ATPase